MSESTTPDLVGLMRRLAEAANEWDFDTADSYYAPDAVWDSSRTGVGSFEGAATIRRFFEDWRRGYEEWDIGFDELREIGSGVVFTLVRQAGRPVGTTGYVRQREAWVWVWGEGLIARVTTYPEADMDEARAYAERLAKERADVELRRGYEALGARDLDEALRLLTHDVVVDMTRTVGVLVHGLDAFRAFQEDWLAGYDEVTYTPEEIIDAGNGVTFVRILQTARPKGTAGHVTQREPNVLIAEDGRVVRMIIYPESELDEARADAERLAEERG